MALRPSRLRRINQRLTLAKYKVRTSTARAFTSLVGVLIAKHQIKKSSMCGITKQKRIWFLFSRTAESRNLNRLLISSELLDGIQFFLILFLLIKILNALFESYSNNKY